MIIRRFIFSEKYLIFFIIFLFSCTQISEIQKINQFFQDEWDENLKNYPEYATFLGVYKYNDKLTDMTLSAIESRKLKTLNSYNKLQSFDVSKFDKLSKLNYDLYLGQLEDDIHSNQFKQYLIPIDQMGGIHISAPNMYDTMPFENEKDYRNYITRLNHLPDKINQIILLMQEGIKQNVMPPKVVLSSVPKQISSQFDLKTEDSPFYTPFVKKPKISNSTWNAILNDAKIVINNKIFPAYRKLYEFFVESYIIHARNNIAISSTTSGVEYYKYLIQHYTTTDLSPQEIHKIGLSEVDRIKKEMNNIISLLGYKGSFDDFLYYLRNDSRFYYKSEEELLNGYRVICKIVDPKLSKLFGYLPRTPYGIKAIPEYQAPSAPTAYYYSGSSQANRPGYFWANTYKLNTRPKYEMTALALHEAVPGHHLQISIADELNNLPEFRKNSSYTAFVEGWALYAESLGVEMEMYDDLYDKFGQLTYEMWRACRLVIDTGIHMFDWSRDEAIEYLTKNTGKTLNDIEVEIDRYIIWPGQALSYKIGELKIKELRDYAKSNLEDNFDIRDFHDIVLQNGAIPLNILEKEIKQYVKDNRK